MFRKDHSAGKPGQNRANYSASKDAQREMHEIAFGVLVKRKNCSRAESQDQGSKSKRFYILQCILCCATLKLRFRTLVKIENNVLTPAKARTPNPITFRFCDEIGRIGIGIKSIFIPLNDCLQKGVTEYFNCLPKYYKSCISWRREYKGYREKRMT